MGRKMYIVEWQISKTFSTKEIIFIMNICCGCDAYTNQYINCQSARIIQYVLNAKNKKCITENSFILIYNRYCLYCFYQKMSSLFLI